MCVVQVKTLVLQRSHKYCELEMFQFYFWSCRWNPQTYVNSWTVRHRDAADTRTRVAVKIGEAEMEHRDPLWDIL